MNDPRFHLSHTDARFYAACLSEEDEKLREFYRRLNRITTCRGDDSDTSGLDVGRTIHSTSARGDEE